MFERYAVTSISTVDWPEYVCSVVWVFGCNFRCPYCHNAELVQGTTHGQPTFTVEELTAGILRRRQLLDGVCISGGEPTISPNIGHLVKSFKAAGLKVKVDTNGSQPFVVRYCLAPDGVDYLAIDIKTDRRHYDHLTHATRDTWKKVEASLQNGLELIPEVELRTTVVPGLNDEAAPHIAEWLAPYAARVSRFSVQAFVPGRSMRADLDSIPRTSHKALDNFAAPLREVGFNVRVVTPSVR